MAFSATTTTTMHSKSIILDTLLNVDLTTAFALLFVSSIPLVLLPYILDKHHIRRNGVPGPPLAAFTDFWLGWVSSQGHRSHVVHDLHERYGTFVRLAPNHVSINHPDALATVYAHGSGTLKSNFYDAFVSIRRGLFNTRSRPEHARKRKIVSNIFAPASVRAFEPHTKLHITNLIRRWDKLCDTFGSGKPPHVEDIHGGEGRVWFDCLPWYNFLAFDIIGDLAFGSPFGMIEKGKDSALVAKDIQAAISAYGASPSSADSKESGPKFVSLPAVQILNDRGEFSASMGVLPPSVRPLMLYLPWFAKGQKAVRDLAGIAVAAVSQRLAVPTDRVDLLSKLQEGRDADGEKMGKEELTAEALTQLIAGSDTTSNTSCAITYHLAANPSVQAKLQSELDAAFPSAEFEADPVPSHDDLKHLPYLEAVISEVLRLHATSGIGLPRDVPAGSSLTILGRTFPEGTTLSVPTYSLHRNKEVWGEDAEVFRPERWIEAMEEGGGSAGVPNKFQRAFNPFSFGPRACVGKNLANMELLMIIASVLRRYHFVLENPGEELKTREGFLRKPEACRVGMKRRM